MFFFLEILINLLGFEDGSKRIKLSDILSLWKMVFFIISKIFSGRLLYLWWFIGYRKYFVKDEVFMFVLYFNDFDIRLGYFRLKCLYG